LAIFLVASERLCIGRINWSIILNTINNTLRIEDIQFINPVIGKILGVKNEQQFVGSLCDRITEENTYLEPLFFIIQDRFDQGEY
jgi:hypothetical protein